MNIRHILSVCLGMNECGKYYCYLRAYNISCKGYLVQKLRYLSKRGCLHSISSHSVMSLEKFDSCNNETKNKECLDIKSDTTKIV